MWLLILLSALIFGGLGLYIAGEKGRSGAEGFALGCLFGPVGAIIEALLPTLKRIQTTRSQGVDRIRELNEMPLVYDEPRVTDDDVDRFING